MIYKVVVNTKDNTGYCVAEIVRNGQRLASSVHKISSKEHARTQVVNAGADAERTWGKQQRLRFGQVKSGGES